MGDISKRNRGRREKEEKRLGGGTVSDISERNRKWMRGKNLG